MSNTNFGKRNQRKKHPGPQVAPEHKKDILVQYLLTRSQAEEFKEKFSIRTDVSVNMASRRIVENMLTLGQWTIIEGQYYLKFPTGRMAEDKA